MRTGFDALHEMANVIEETARNLTSDEIKFLLESLGATLRDRIETIEANFKQEDLELRALAAECHNDPDWPDWGSHETD